MTAVFMKFTEIQATRSPSRWKMYIGLHCITYQKDMVFTGTAVRMSSVALEYSSQTLCLFIF
jgi:hypothetical protein